MLGYFYIFGLLGIGATQTISSIGKYSNDDFTWATNIPELQFNSSFDCSGEALCQISWWLGSVRVAYCDDPNWVLLEPSIGNISCDAVGGLISTEITFFDQFNSTGDIEVRVIIDGTVSSSTSELIKIKNCDSSSSGNITNTVNSTGLSTTFDETISANCSNGFEAPSNPTIKCKFDSSWSQEGNCTAITCGYTRCAGCCNNNLELASITLNYDEYLNITCCDSFIPSGQSEFTCINGNAFSPNLTCVPVPTTPPQLTTAPTTTGTTTISTDGTTVSTGNSTIIDPISAGYDSSTSAQTEGGNKTGATDRMSEGDIAGTVLTCIFILECICLCVFVFALNYDLSLKLIIGLYVAGICLSIIGIFMSFFGSSTAGTVMNSVEIAGTVLGSVGITVMLGGIVMQALKGVGSKDYAAGEPPK